MSINVFSVESLMVERRTEVEKAAAIAWQWNTGKNKINLFSSVASKLSSVKAVKGKVQVQQSACCNCC
jgi:hypothetical protein